MTDTVFRTRTEAKEEPEKNENIVTKEVRTSIVHEEVPYTDYQAEHGKPYTANYFNLGSFWEVYNDEISTIENYIEEKIKSGELANDVKAIEKELKKMEKLHDLKDESRIPVRMGIISSYINFLNSSKGIKINSFKYGRP